MASATAPRDALQRLLDGVQTLIREHMALARVEIREDARAMGRDLLVGAAGLPALVAGYLLLMMAMGFLLALVVPTWAAFGLVALLNLAAGGALTLAGVRKVTGDRMELPRTAEELRRDKAWLAEMKNGGQAAKLAAPAQNSAVVSQAPAPSGAN